MKQKKQPEVLIRTYRWKGEGWAALYIDNVCIGRFRAGKYTLVQWLAQRLKAKVIDAGEARNPKYFTLPPPKSPLPKPPRRKPDPGLINDLRALPEIAPSRMGAGPPLVADPPDPSEPPYAEVDRPQPGADFAHFGWRRITPLPPGYHRWTAQPKGVRESAPADQTGPDDAAPETG